MEELIQLDKDLFLFLNNLGSEQWDGFWLIITKQIYWSPIFIFVFYFIIKKIGWKQFGILVLFLAALITFTDQLTNLAKYMFERLRPCNDPTLEGLIRMKEGWARKSFGYFSGHASNSMATTTFIFFLFRKHFKYLFLLFLFPLIFAYSRIYLGLHFPADIISGYIFGIFTGTLFYRIYKIMQPKYFPTN
ncbi:MAG TPA: phosphatase PAP2 family protein [Flavobacterium sp.]|uniref:phosphatase PAP2 family protein n=1 Tax=unclassified Flavobacterium TaxID=196869 RepID=UPI0025BCAE4A|nr:MULTISPECIES: phosphatase PAP2 family protein [unclassified Flavobacterium]HRE78598.1 phosphatase PAP2 family protein [Flavobacterium sp.]